MGLLMREEEVMHRVSPVRVRDPINRCLSSVRNQPPDCARVAPRPADGFWRLPQGLLLGGGEICQQLGFHRADVGAGGAPSCLARGSQSDDVSPPIGELGVRVTYLATPSSADTSGPDCDFAVPVA